jgi:hypothetical protein
MSKSDRYGFIKDNPEPPPPYSGDTRLWAEDLDNYLRRRFQMIDERVKSLEELAKARLNSASSD